MGMVRAYLATSLDGFVAGENDDLGWLEPRPPGSPPIAVEPWASREGDALEFDDFLTRVGCLLMGRRTYDVVAGFEEWPYGDVPMLVATHRPLDAAPPTVAAAAGDLGDLIASARALAGEKDVYLDGAAMVREALDRGLLDHLVMTVVPTVLGRGIPLFSGVSGRRHLTVERVARFGEGLVQVHLRAPATGEAAARVEA